MKEQHIKKYINYFTMGHLDENFTDSLCFPPYGWLILVSNRIKKYTKMVCQYLLTHK